MPRLTQEPSPDEGQGGTRFQAWCPSLGWDPQLCPSCLPVSQAIHSAPALADGNRVSPPGTANMGSLWGPQS